MCRASGRGGYTTYADILARHLGAHLPGKPNVIVRTMPGAGGLNGTQHLFNVAMRDGSVLGVVRQAVAVPPRAVEQAKRFSAPQR